MIRLTSKHIWGYGFGNFGYGIIFQIIATYFVFYATAVLGLSGTLIGIMVGVGVIWDAVSDPIMGYISDNTKNKKYGRRHLYLWIGGFSVLLTNLIIWNLHTSIPKWMQVGGMIIALLMIKTGMTIYITPYNALGAEITDDHVKRAKVQSVKMSFFLLGIFVATAVNMLLFFKATPEYPIGQLNPIGYRYMSIFTTILMAVSMFVVLRSTNHMIPELKKRIIENKNTGLKDFFLSITKAFRQLDFRAVVIGYLFTNLASALLSTIGLHVYTYTFKMGNMQIALIAGSQLLMAVISQPFWLWLNKSMDKAKSIRLGLAMSIISSLYFIICVVFRTVTADNLWILIPFILLGGAGTGGLVMLPQAMVADTVDANAVVTGQRQEGVYYGTLTLTYKVSQSIAIVFIGIILDWVGFDTSLTTQKGFTLTSLGLILGIGSLLAFCAAYISYKYYKLNRTAMTEIHKQLNL
jgi:Na+/melibiose symporter-like transporter